jgi:hypothetical protein
LCGSPFDERPQVLAADLAGRLDAVTELAQGIGERVERRVARLPRQVRATQLVADPLEIGFEFGLSAHRFRCCFTFLPLHVRAFPAGSTSCLFPSRAAGRAVIRSGEFRGLTTARAGGMRCCPREKREIEAALQGAARDG